MKTFLIFLFLGLLCQTAVAHDFFLYPSGFNVQPGESVLVAIHVDDRFPGNPTKWNPSRVTRFEWWHNRQRDTSSYTRLPDSSGVSLAIRKPGLHLVALDWSARLIELKSEDFSEYLSSEGLNHILDLRKRRGEEKKTGRERYSRFVKTLINSGSGVDDRADSVVQQVIEIVALENPYVKRVGDSIRVKVLFRGAPLSNALISATYAGFTDKPDTYAQSARTDTYGIAQFPLTSAGPWLVRTVHMLPSEGDPEADWESWWASITFEVKK